MVTIHRAHDRWATVGEGGFVHPGCRLREGRTKGDVDLHVDLHAGGPGQRRRMEALAGPPLLLLLLGGSRSGGDWGRDSAKGGWSWLLG